MEQPWGSRVCKRIPCLVTSKVTLSAPHSLEEVKERERGQERVEMEPKMQNRKQSGGGD